MKVVTEQEKAPQCTQVPKVLVSHHLVSRDRLNSKIDTGIIVSWNDIRETAGEPWRVSVLGCLIEDFPDMHGTDRTL
jgi:hypothetical protein